MSYCHESSSSPSEVYKAELIADLHDEIERFIENAPADLVRRETSFSNHDLTEEQRRQIAFPPDIAALHLFNQTEPESYSVKTTWELGQPQFSFGLKMTDGTSYSVRNIAHNHETSTLHTTSTSDGEDVYEMANSETSKLILSLVLNKHQRRRLDEIRSLDNEFSEVPITDQSVVMLFENAMTHAAHEKSELTQVVADTEDDNRTIMVEKYEQDDGVIQQKLVFAESFGDINKRLIYESGNKSVRLLELSHDNNEIRSEQRLHGPNVDGAYQYMIQALTRELNQYTDDYSRIEDLEV